MLVKVCGMRDGENIRLVENLSVDLIGFIFYPRSPRYVNSLPKYLPRSAGRVGVFVNEKLGVIEDAVIRYGLTHVQLHGSEIPSVCVALRQQGIQVIKAFSVSVPDDLMAVIFSCSILLRPVMAVQDVHSIGVYCNIIQGTFLF